MQLIQGVVDGFIMTVGITPPKPEKKREATIFIATGLLRAKIGTNCMFELPVDASPTLLPIKVNPFVRFYGRPFKNSAFPCVIGPGWQR